MSNMVEKEIKHLVGIKVVKVEYNQIYFEDGTVIDFHPFETYVYKKQLKN